MFSYTYLYPSVPLLTANPRVRGLYTGALLGWGDGVLRGGRDREDNG
jgi:hypothetical protein